MPDMMKIEEVRDLIAASACPSAAVDTVETYLSRHRVLTHGDTNTYAAINATVWLLVISQFKLRLKHKE
ncbi:MAG: hypothetical protein CVU43_17845 [Chloroflexi bacterium HGW-Chloroflexi-5]|jgi:hypothetical protein|nr:MAG: hypothetical protein CVU43_17845 [Chloroflexi bacterium HGW-Chloroflexi-5]